jgi:ADP-heptose:LPS heptosyltransferase
MEFFARSSAALCYLSGASRRVGFHAFSGEGAQRGDLMTHRLSCNPLLHAGQVFRSLVEAVLVDPDRLPALPFERDHHWSPPSFEPAQEEREALAKLVKAELGQETLPPLVLLNASCADLVPLRRWPAERYAELAGRILEAYPGAAVAFTGLPSERRRAAELAARVRSDRCVNLAGQTSLRDLLVLFWLAELLVTNDSGPAHFAALTPVDVITLFGPETPAVFGSRGPRSHVLWAGLPCSPCVNAFNDRNSPCRDNLCMQEISVDRVFQSACKVLDKRLP